MNMIFLLLAPLIISCSQPGANQEAGPGDSIQVTAEPVDSLQHNDGTVIQTGNTTPSDLLAFAQSQVGVPYKYGSTDPGAGFDCSGFITYVFNHFNIQVPRSSVDFTNVEREIDPATAKPGDLILFTGTDSTTRVVGHMGIVTSVDDGVISFIHSSSGKANGVTVTPLNSYYQGRFMKVIRVFRQND